MFSHRILPLGLLLLAGVCSAQTLPIPTAGPVALDQKTSRRVEIIARQKLKVPAEYQVTVGSRLPSDIPGFDNVRITFSLPGHPDHSQTLSFLLSKDGNTLGRLTQWSLADDPARLAPTANRPMRGSPDAKVTVVNYDDLECPYCAKMHAELFPATLDHYKGLIKVVYRDLPLEEIHPWAMHAAVDANCLASQNASAYWNYVDYLHLHGQDVSGPEHDLAKSKVTLDKLAADEGTKDKLDLAALNACTAKQDESTVRSESKLAEDQGIGQTPTLFVNGEEMEGALDEATLWTVIDRALISEGVTPPANPAATPAPAAPAKPADAPKTGDR